MIIIQTWVIFQCQVKTFNQDPVPKSSLLLAVYQKPLENRKHREWNDRLLANQNIHSSKSKADMIPWSGEDWKILNGFRYYCMIKKHALNDTKLGVEGNGNGSSFSPNGNCSIGKWLIFFLKAWHPPRAVFPPFYSVTSERRPKYLWQWDNGPDKKHLEQWPPGYSSSRIRFLFLVYAAVYREWIQTYP